MAQSRGGRCMVGEYVVGKQIGSGSFSTVWHGRHRIHGTEVAIKEIVTARLNHKLQESLKSEIVILKKINHPNIIRLHDMIESSRRKYEQNKAWKSCNHIGQFVVDSYQLLKKITARLNNKLQESLKSEIFILKKIYHPNIIRLNDMIEDSGKIYIILEYCRGGDLSVYVQQRKGRIPEATAKHFMQQLASGLKVLRENNLIHRDLKPQNLLLTANDDKSTLKIADFGFARSLQPRGLAETLCGSPLYMAPEIMQNQKYDAKADLWSVGAILYQLVTGKTPYTGSDQTQLLQNILKSTELQFPPDATDLTPSCIDLCRKLLRRNPVERLTFEEFFNHPFLSQRLPDQVSRNSRPQRVIDSFPLSEVNPVRSSEESSQEDCLPFSLDEDSSGPEGSPSFVRRSPVRSTYGFSVDSRSRRNESSNPSNRIGSPSNQGSTTRKPDVMMFSLGRFKHSEGNLNEPLKSLDSKAKTADPMELVDQDYVLVSSPPMGASSPASMSKLSNFPFKSGSPLQNAGSSNPTSTVPMPILSAATGKVGRIDSFESRSSAPGTSQGSTDMVDALEQPSTDCMTRIKSLQRCASAVTELVNEKLEAGKQLEAFSIQLVILAIWNQALHICHTQAVSALEGSPITDSNRFREVTKVQGSPDIHENLDPADSRVSQDIYSAIERTFRLEVGNAEELAKVVEPGNTEMPDAMESIFQSALALGRRGAVDEYMGDPDNAVLFYSKAVRLFVFLLVEAPSLILNPPFSLTNSDRYRLQNYIDLLSNRHSISRSQRMAVLKSEDQQLAP